MHDEAKEKSIGEFHTISKRKYLKHDGLHIATIREKECDECKRDMYECNKYLKYVYMYVFGIQETESVLSANQWIDRRE